MKINKITVHNFRSIKEITFNVEKYSCLVGANNSGKSNLISALRIFYEDIKYNEKTDFPKFKTDDDESWIEIEYELTKEESESLKKEYQTSENILKIRKYLKSKDKVKSNQSNLYAYENGNISNNLFYGAKNISEAKLGKIIYIPETATTDETLKLTGPSPLRDIINFIVNKVIEKSDALAQLENAFKEFNKTFPKEPSQEGLSLQNLQEDINQNLKEWEVEFNLNINPIKHEDIIKNLISHYAYDKNLNQEIEIKFLGQGLQRHLIYTLLKLSTKYTEKRTNKRTNDKKEFSPDFTLILFEEPEAFLHPSQQELLNYSLKDLSAEEGQQVILTTHSPIFVSKNIEDISSIIRFKRINGITVTYQISLETKKNIINQNNELISTLQEKLKDPNLPQQAKNRIEQDLRDDNIPHLERDSIRYMLWLDSERCSAFFSNIVLICEGASEKCFIDYLIKNNKWENFRERRIYVLDAMGKYNIHRYMNLFKELGILHSVLMDKDEDKTKHDIINEFIKSNKNDFTIRIDLFDKDIENFLGIPTSRKDIKPLNIMWHYFNEKIQKEKIDQLKNKVKQLLEEN